MASQYIRTTTQITVEQQRRIKEIAYKSNKSIADIIRQALEEYLKNNH